MCCCCFYQFNFKFYFSYLYSRYILFNFGSISKIELSFSICTKKKNNIRNRRMEIVHIIEFRHWITLTMSLTLIRFVVDFKFAFLFSSLFIRKPIFVHWMTVKYTHESLLESDSRFESPTTTTTTTTKKQHTINSHSIHFFYEIIINNCSSVWCTYQFGYLFRFTYN